MKRFIAILGMAAALGASSCQRETDPISGPPEQVPADGTVRYREFPVTIGAEATGDEAGTRSLVTINAEDFKEAYLYAFDASTKEILMYPDDGSAGDHRRTPVTRYTTERTFNWALPVDTPMDIRVIVNPADTVSLKRIINTPKRSIGDATVARLEDEAARQEIPLFSVLPDPPESLSARARRCVSGFAELMFRLIAAQDTMNLTDYVTFILKETALDQQLDNEDAEFYQARLDNLRELVSAVHEYETKSEDHSLNGYLENVSLITDLDRQEDAPQYVTLMTLHAAKGLEYDAVFLPGMEENVFPNYRAIQEDNRLEEERRLAYVGITRAKKYLFLSCARQRTFYNQVNYNAPSVFLSEIPERLINDVRKSARQHFGEDPVRRSAARPQRPLDFGVPGTGQKRDPLTIPGVTKGFVPSAARALSGSALMNMYKPGDRVMHRKFGEGTVEKVWGKGGEARISISFTAYGTKEFSLSIAPIFKIDT